MPWPRFERMLTGAVLDLDPDAVRAREIRPGPNGSSAATTATMD